MFGIPYTRAIDMWSLGCILAELFTGNIIVGVPLFPGENENEHMSLIMELRGIPKLSLVMTGARWRHFFSKEGNPIIYKNAKGTGYLPGSKCMA